MSLLVLLDIEGLTPDQGVAVEAACAERGAWPMTYFPGGRRKRLFRKPKHDKPNIWMPEQIGGGRYLISDNAMWDEPYWDLEPEFRPRLAEAFRILGEFVPQGFRFRATWDGDEVRHTKIQSAEDLADLAEASRINRYTLYVVPART